MVRKKMESSEPNAFESALELLEAYVKLLRSVKAERVRVDDLARLAGALRRLTPSERAALFSSFQEGSSEVKKKIDAWPLENVATLTHAQVETYLADKDIPKAKLQQIATGRFGMSRGSLSALPREALLEKIRTLVQHEGTHESIARAASGGASPSHVESTPVEHGGSKLQSDSSFQDTSAGASKDAD